MALQRDMALPDAEFPELAQTMLMTRMLNDWLHTNYSMDAVAEMDPVLFDVLSALKQGLNPGKVKEEKAKEGKRGRK